MFFSNGAAWADDSPTLDQVYKATQAGNLEEAQRMMDKVLKEHPDSAKAHFVEAEILAKQGQMGRAEAELNNAEQLKPALPFVKPQAVQDLKSRIGAAHRVSQPQPGSFQSADNGFPWGMIFLGLGASAIIFFIIRAINARNAANFPANYKPGNYQPGMQSAAGAPVPMQPYGGGMAAPAAGGLGGGIMGGLATGAAVGVGMVAGEALAHRFMDGGHGDVAHSASNNVTPVADTWGSSSSDMGGADFGIADNSSWSDSSSVADSGADVGGSDWS